MDRTQEDIRSIVSDRALFEPFADSTFMVTGATGLIGSMLIKTLLTADEAYKLNIRTVGQIRDAQKAGKVFGGLKERVVFTATEDVPCDFIVHTVSPTNSRFFIDHPVETIRSSVCSAMSVLETARKHHASMVYLSSMEQYGVPFVSGQVMTEDKTGIIDPLNKRSSYSESKRLCECLCASYAAEYGVRVSIARLAQTFGAGMPLTDTRMPMQFAKAVVDGRDIVLHTEGKSVCNFVYLTDALKAVFLLLVRGTPGQAYNVCCDGESRTVAGIAHLVSETVAGGAVSVRIEKRDGMGYAPDTVMFLNSEKLRTLGWKAEVGMEEAYRRLVEYLKPDYGM